MFRIFGPPGTGKTTTLLNMVDKALDSGVGPLSIAFLAFTKKAATEAKERAVKRFNLDPDRDLIYFRTLHSLALSVSDIQTDQIMQMEHFKQLGKAIGVDFSPAQEDDSDFGAITRTTHPVLNLINLARLRKVPLRRQYDLSNLSQDWIMVNYIDASYREFKKAFNLYDFTDMLEMFVKEGHEDCPHFELTFLDEAQDLSPLQWEIAHIIDSKSKKMYCAGDDDQAIYKWAGADVDHFIGLDGGVETLSQSYRVPAAVHEVATNIASRITGRFPKVYNPNDNPGHVERVYDVMNLDLGQGEWLILAQANYILKGVYQQLRSLGLFFREHRKNSSSVDAKIAVAVMSWESLRKGNKISGEQARTMYSCILSHVGVKRGFKKLPGLGDEDKVSMGELVENFGLVVDPELIWSDALKMIPQEDRAYLTALLRRGEKILSEPRIKVSTIHGAKGGEAENVVVLQDISSAAADHQMVDPDSLHRVFYVAVTRSKKNLYIVEPENFERCYYI